MAFRAVSMMGRSVYQSMFAAAPALPKAAAQVARPVHSQATLRAAAEATAAAAPAAPAAYSSGVQAMHWLVGGGTIGCFASVQMAMQSKGKEKGQWMQLHKSLGLGVAGLVLPRIIIRLASKAPAPIPGSKLEHLGAAAVHWAYYVMMVGMPATGIAMGYYGGKGLPFFGLYTVPGKALKEDGDGNIAKGAFKVHKNMGQAMEYLTPLHVGAVGVHALKGQNILRRIVPGMA